MHQQDNKPKSRKSSWLLLSVKLFCSIVFFLVLLEFALRVTGFAPQPESSEEMSLEGLSEQQLIKRAASRSLIHKPSISNQLENLDLQTTINIQRNNCGCREDTDISFSKSKDQTRVLVLGDSHTDGAVENHQTYANLLEQSLDDSIEVFNCAQGAKSPYQAWLAYRDLYQNLDADYLILGLYAGNDFLDLEIQHDRVHLQFDGDKYVSARPTSRPDIIYEHQNNEEVFESWYLSQTATICTLQKLGWLSSPGKQAKVQKPKTYFDPLHNAKNQFAAATWQGLNQAYYFKHYPDQWVHAENKLRFVLNKFQHEFPKEKFLVVLIPTYRQLNPEVTKQASQILNLTPQDQAFDEQAYQTMLHVCQELEINHLGMLESFEEQNGKLYWDFDHHINDAGHQVIAAELHKMIEQNFQNER